MFIAAWTWGVKSLVLSDAKLKVSLSGLAMTAWGLGKPR